MRSEPRWLPLEEVVASNFAAVTAANEPFQLIQKGLLESALARAANHWHHGKDDVVRLAVILMLGIARNHPFIQGNKRTGFMAAAMFLELNGYELDAPDTDEFAESLIAVIVGTISEDEFLDNIREHVVAAH